MNSLSEKEHNALAEIKEKIAGRYNLHSIKLFGSKARGDADQESDIDIVVVVDHLTWSIEKDIYEICFYTGLHYDVLISPIVFSQEEINSKLTKATTLYKAIEKEGIVL